ncbi:urease accessory protein UreF [Pacificibacter marinus]|uniref:urease accessory protein UreF n=1 Tax=Pacificibacter marinus TaxID=658057 RepID=UPI001C065DF8|nr:urease accessory UreF family protein [Pacificibacter marinus]MBU2868659.1 urease accessory protein UreF [Pacificibacter marinus]
MRGEINPTPATLSANLGLLSLTQWLSPSFPLGAFAYSHALELAITEGKVNDAATLKAWLSDTLAYGGGKVDAWLLAMTLAGGDPRDLADLAEALAGTRERWMETSDQGAAFVRTVAQMGGPEIASCALPVAVGQAARALDVDAETVIALYLHSFTANLVSAAVRFVPLGQSAGQSVLAGLHDQIAAQARAALGATVEGLTTSAFVADLGAAQHEDMDVRLFKS